MIAGSEADLRRTLFHLRRRRGAFAHKPAWLAETARLKSLLRPGSLELQVFEAIEIEGRTFKAAASTLGLSERHLYRVRRSMIEQLLSLPAHPITSEPRPPAGRDLEVAGDLLARGHASAALASLRRILEHHGSAAAVVEALALRARALSDLEEFDAAGAAIAQARRYINQLPFDERGDFVRDVVMAHAYDLYRRGLYDDAIGVAERALLNAPPSPRANPYDVRALARHLIFLGIMHQEGGSAQASLVHLEAAQDMLYALPEPPAAELAQISLNCAFSRAAIPGELHRARLDAHRALDRAQWHGLVYEVVWANLAVAMIEEVAENARAGLSYAHAALSLARAFFSGDPFARTMFLTSRVESAIGDHEHALARLREAEPHTGTRGLMRSILYVAQARVHRASESHRETIVSATQAIETLESKSHTHYIGMPYLARAAARQIGEREGAREDADAAVHYLERGGSVRDFALALELSAKICGRRAHLERARELRAAL
jgi:tetratricopeptide (TPR) repeat protein